MAVMTVSQINKYIGFNIKNDTKLQNILIKGEISNFTHHFRTGHLYFSLKDDKSAIKAVMFSGAASRLKFKPQDGMSVIISGSIAVFERDGLYQIYVNDIQPEGVGAVHTAFEQLKEKLFKAGLFNANIKKSIPLMPKKIGVVTSKTGAALQDIINIMSRRYPIGELIVINAFVQGDKAPDSIAEGIEKAEKLGCDVIIVGRGGGASEDLSAFNTEKVAYAIYNCQVPIISAVGHEIDFSIADLTADLRAATPSAAAELAVPDIKYLLNQVDVYKKRVKSSIMNIFDKKTNSLTNINARLLKNSPENRLKLNFERLSSLDFKLESVLKSKFQKADSILNENIVKLESLSPLKVLSRGYSLVYKESKLINNALELNKGDKINIRFGNGEIEAEVLT